MLLDNKLKEALITNMLEEAKKVEVLKRGQDS